MGGIYQSIQKRSQIGTKNANFFVNKARQISVMMLTKTPEKVQNTVKCPLFLAVVLYLLYILTNGKFRQIINSKCPHNSENENYKHHSNYLMTVCELYFFIWATFCQHVAVLYILVIQVHGNQMLRPNEQWQRLSFGQLVACLKQLLSQNIEHWIQAKLSRQSQLKNTRLF